MVYIFRSKKKKPDDYIESPGRRKSLENIVKGIIFIGGAAYTWRCKGNTTTPDIPIPVTLNFEIYNHSQGYIQGKNFSKNVMSSDPVSIRIDQLGVTGVDDKRIAIYEQGFTRKISFTSTGETTINAPKQNTNYNIIVFNALGKDVLDRQVSYDWMDEQSARLYKSKHDYTVYREDRDGVTGPEGSWQSVWNQLNSALDLGWVKWGSITSKPMPNDGQGDFSYGYGICIYGDNQRADGLHAGSYILVDPEMCPTEKGRRAVGLSEAFENICSVNNIGGYPSSMTIQYQGVLSQTGKDLFAYVFVKG